MRALTASIAFSLALSGQALAKPWSEHPLLSFAATPLAVADPASQDDMQEAGTTLAYFRAVTVAGASCDAVDGTKRRITVTCAEANGRHKTVYRGEFVGAGYLLVEAVAVDGRLLSASERVALIKSINQVP